MRMSSTLQGSREALSNGPRISPPPCVQRLACTQPTTCRADRSLPALHACASSLESTVLLPPTQSCNAATHCRWCLVVSTASTSAEGRGPQLRHKIKCCCSRVGSKRTCTSKHTPVGHTHARQGHRGSLFICACTQHAPGAVQVSTSTPKLARPHTGTPPGHGTPAQPRANCSSAAGQDVELRTAACAGKIVFQAAPNRVCGAGPCILLLAAVRTSPPPHSRKPAARQAPAKRLRMDGAGDKR